MSIVTVGAVRDRIGVPLDPFDRSAVMAPEAEAVGIGDEKKPEPRAVGIVADKAPARREWAVNVPLALLEVVTLEAELVPGQDERVRGGGVVTGAAELRGVGAMFGVA